jgi:hypothetical protein
MREGLLITTAIGLMLGAGAYAQSPSEQPRNSSPPAAQSQNNSNSSAPSASSSTPSSQSSTPSAQNTQSSPSASSRSQTTTSQSTPAAGSNDSSRSQAQSHQASPPSQARQDSNAAAPSQTQSAPQPNSSSQAQTNTAPPANNRTQSAPSDTNTNTNAGTQPSTNTAAQPSNNQTNTAAQPSNNQTGTAQSRSSNVNISANLDDRQRTRVTESITKLNARPVENVNFSLSVGKVVPRDVRFQPLPADVVEVVPQYRGYNFFVVRDDIVIVDPSSYQIVDVLPRTGRAPASRKMTFSDTDRAVIRKHARSARTEQRTTGSSTTSTRVRVGDRLPDSVEIRSFPEEVYRESPTLREYRYIERDNRTYVVEPHERTIIEEID